MGYVYQEYPKCLYQRDGTTCTVTSEEEEVRCAAQGWITAKQFHAKSEALDMTKEKKPDANLKRR